MNDWKDKIEQEYREKIKKDQEEEARRQNHDKFISSEGWSAWQELTRKTEEMCQHLSSRARSLTV
jgi:hypothetical protein